MGIDLFEQLSEKISVGDVLNHLSSMLMKSVFCIGFTFLIYMFLLYGSSMRTFEKSSIRYKIENQITRYLIIKTVLSLLAGTISYCIYGVFLHVPMAFIFAMLFFALNFIPHIVIIRLSLDPRVPSLLLVFQFHSFCSTLDSQMFRLFLLLLSHQWDMEGGFRDRSWISFYKTSLNPRCWGIRCICIL